MYQLDEQSPKCDVCEKTTQGTRYIGVDKSSRKRTKTTTSKCLRCFILDSKLLKRSIVIAFVVGTILNVTNYGNLFNSTIIQGDTYKLGLNFIVPFLVSLTTSLLVARTK